MDIECTTPKQYQLSISLIKSAWRIEARILPAVSMLSRKANHHESQACELNREVHCSRNILLPGFINYCFYRLCFLLCCVWISDLHQLRSRSHLVPRRGERVKQGTVHPRNIAIIRPQNSSVGC